MTNLAERLKELRNEKKLSQKDIAQYLKVDTRQIQNYEYDKAHPPLNRVIELADLFGVSIDYLTGRSDKRNC